jgi:hypothetical protein
LRAGCSTTFRGGLEVQRRSFQLRKSLVLLRRIVIPMSEVVSELMRRDLHIVGDDLMPYYQDIYDQVLPFGIIVPFLLDGAFQAVASLVARDEGRPRGRELRASGEGVCRVHALSLSWAPPTGMSAAWRLARTPSWEKMMVPSG